MAQAIAIPVKRRDPMRVWRTIRDFAKAKPLGFAGAVIFIIMILVAVLAQWISPYDPLSTNVMQRLQPPSSVHALGTDELGRDILARVIYGARISALVGILATFAGSSIGAIIGVSSGFLGGKLDMVVQRLLDILMSFPALVLSIALMSVMGAGIFNVIIAIAIPFIAPTNRVVRSVAVSVKQLQYVEAAQSIGASRFRIIARHILPNCLASYLILVTSQLGGAILVEASLSFLGLGVPPPAPSWGRSLNEAMQYMYRAPWLSIFPGIAISLVVFGINMFGDALRDIWDPRLKRV
ncbi:MAG: ABC transporter permease [Dehalococcoidales bacterium]|nr:ABC transporter permease [Dehalococcoidales bacterium]